MLMKHGASEATFGTYCSLSDCDTSEVMTSPKYNNFKMKAALGGDLERVERIVKLGVFIASEPDFTDQPEAANGASDLMEAVFGDAGKHARAAVSVPVLPRNATVEIDCVVQVRAAE